MPLGPGAGAGPLPKLNVGGLPVVLASGDEAAAEPETVDVPSEVVTGSHAFKLLLKPLAGNADAWNADDFGLPLSVFKGASLDSLALGGAARSAASNACNIFWLE